MSVSMNRTTLRLAALTVLGLVASSLPALAGQPVAHLYWAVTEEAGGVWRARADGDHPEQVVAAATIPEVGLEPTQGLLFYPVIDGAGQGRLWRSDLDGNDRVAIVDGIGEVTDIEVDATGGKVYWSEPGSVRRAGLDGSAPETLVTASTPRGIALDLEAGRLYYNSNFQMRSANLDGSDVVALGSLPSATPSGLEVDTVNDKLYYSQGLQGQGLHRCELDLTGCSTIVTGAVNEFELVGDTIYYWQLSGLWRADLDGSSPQQLAVGFIPNSFEVDPGQLQIYFADTDVFRSELDGSNPEPLVGAPGLLIHDVAVDAAAARLYLSDADFDAGSIVGTPWDGSFLRQVTADPEGFDRVRGLALDAAAGRLYWADGDDPGGIWAIDVDGKDKTEIVSALTHPHDVALDTVAGKVYWTEGIGGGTGTGAAIGRANLDGSSPETLLSDLSDGIRGIDVDPVGGALYWTDHVADQIWTSDLDGGNAAALPLAVTDPHDVAVDSAAGYLYWTEGASDDDNLTGKIRRANLDGTSPIDVLIDLSDRIRDLTVVYHDPIPFFADGFESGDTSAWSAAVP